MEKALLGSPALAKAWEIDDWLLIELGRAPQHPTWFATVASGGSDGATVLGTPLTTLQEDDAVGEVTLLRSRAR